MLFSAFTCSTCFLSTRFLSTTLKSNSSLRMILKTTFTSKCPCLWRPILFKVDIRRSYSSRITCLRSPTTSLSVNSLMPSGTRSHVQPSAPTIVCAFVIWEKCSWSMKRLNWWHLLLRTNSKQHLRKIPAHAIRLHGKFAEIACTSSKQEKKSLRSHHSKWLTFPSTTQLSSIESSEEYITTATEIALQNCKKKRNLQKLLTP